MDQVQVTPGLIVALILIVVWQVFWKGVALWRAAKAHQKVWFIVLLLLAPFTVSSIDLFGVLDIVYLFFFSKHKLTVHEMTKWFKKKVD